MKASTVIFCGGRGSANLIRSCIQDPRMDLCLLVNAYDDGLSTGRIRSFIPGLLGPSDLRKNLSYLLDLSTDSQFACLELLEYRLPQKSEDALQLWNRFSTQKDNPLSSTWWRVSRKQREALSAWISAFEDYRRDQNQSFDFADCAIGNIFIAGAFLQENRSFNSAIEQLSKHLRARAQVLNITEGENLYLGGRRRSGTWCYDEAEMVNSVVTDPFEEVYLFAEKPAAEVRLVANAETSFRPSLTDVTPKANPKALERIESADLIIYGAGSQSSSLWPSYLTEGVAETIANNSQSQKIFLVNILPDNDIRGFGAFEIVQGALRHLRRQAPHLKPQDLIEEVLAHEGPHAPSSLDSVQTSSLQPIRWVSQNWEHAELPGTHSGSKLISYFEKRKAPEKLRIQIELLGSSQNRLRSVYEKQLADLRSEPRSFYLELLPAGRSASHEGEYKLLLGGDGIYSMSDLPFAIELLRSQQVDVLVGSRVLKKAQFQDSLQSAYRLNPILQRLAKAGAFLASLIFSIRFGQFLSDPLSDWLLVRREIKNTESSTKLLIQSVRQEATILEIPIHYQRASLSGGAGERFSKGFKKLITLFLSRP